MLSEDFGGVRLVITGVAVRFEVTWRFEVTGFEITGVTVTWEF